MLKRVYIIPLFKKSNAICIIHTLVLKLQIFKFMPCSITSQDSSFTLSYFLIQYVSLASWTNLSLLTIFSIGRNTRSLCEWPASLKCAPTGLVVLAWQGWVVVPTCSPHLTLAGLLVTPTYPTYPNSPTKTQVNLE